MTRGLNAAFLGQLQSDDPKPTVLLEIGTGTTPATIYITNLDRDLMFPASSGTTYTTRPFEIGGYKLSGSDRSAVGIKFGDADAYWTAWLASTDFRFQRVKRYLIERDSLDSAAKGIFDTFRVVRVDRQDREVTFTIEPLAGILSHLRVPKKSLTREDYPGIPNEGVIGG